MDLSTLVDAEQLYTLEVLNPVTDEPLGITFQIRSAGSKEAKALLRRHNDAQLERLQKRKLLKGSEMERQNLEQAASYIAAWDWGEHTYEGEVPTLSMDTAIRILDREGWIYSQVVEAANSIANFTPASAKNSPKRSK